MRQTVNVEMRKIDQSSQFGRKGTIELCKTHIEMRQM